MESIVKELQKELLSKNCDLLSSLRKAHIIASKLKLENNDRWIISELNGYENYDDIPDYRTIHGEIKAFNPYHGWIPVIIPNQKEHEILTSSKLYESISSLIEISKSKNELSLNFTGPQQRMLGELVGNSKYQYSLKFGSNQITSIIESVKNALLEWTLTLEANNILGLDYIFKNEEIDSAKNLDKTIINNYGNIFTQTKIDNSNINNNVNELDYEKVILLLSEAANSIHNESVEIEDILYIQEELEKTKKMCESKKKKAIIKNALKVICDYCISVGASVTAAVIQKSFM